DLESSVQIEEPAVPGFVEVRLDDERVTARGVERQAQRGFARGAEVLDRRRLSIGIVDFDGYQSDVGPIRQFAARTVTDPVRKPIDANEAWIRYVDKGAVGDKGQRPVRGNGVDRGGKRVMVGSRVIGEHSLSG